MFARSKRRHESSRFFPQCTHKIGKTYFWDQLYMKVCVTQSFIAHQTEKQYFPNFTNMVKHSSLPLCCLNILKITQLLILVTLRTDFLNIVSSPLFISQILTCSFCTLDVAFYLFNMGKQIPKVLYKMFLLSILPCKRVFISNSTKFCHLKP